MKNLFVTALILALAGCSGISASGGGTAPEKNTGFLGSTKSDLDIGTAKAFSGKKDVVIGAFRVGFVTYNRVSHSTGSSLLAAAHTAGRASARSTLMGIDDATMQKITDAAYADFIATLKSNGYNVIDHAKLAALPEYRKMGTEKAPYKTEDQGTDLTYFTPAGLPLKGSGFGFSHPLSAMAVAAEKLGAPVLDVDYKLNFANGSGAGFSVATVEVGQGISVPVGSGITLIGGQMGTFSNNVGSVKLGQPVYSTETFASIEDTTTNADVAMQTAANVVSHLLGSGGTATKAFNFHADPAKYRAVSEKVLADTNKRIIGGMAANR
jgi:hypothetical protein